MTDLTVHADVGDDDLVADWRDLVDRDPHATVFQTPRYLRTWQRTLGVDEDVVSLALRDGDRLVGVVTEATWDTPEGTVVGLAGGTEVTDYRGPVAQPDAAKDLATAWAARLADHEADTISLSAMADDTGWPDLLATALEATTATDVAREPHDVAPVVDLSDGYEAWQESLDGKDRKELRRKARKLARDLGDTEVREVDAAGLEAGLERFLHLNDGAADDKAAFFARDDIRTWFHALAEEYHGDGVFRLHELTLAGQAVAANVSLVWGDRWGLYNSAVHPRLAGFSTGNVLVAELVEVAAREGLATFDLLRGDEAYKYRFGAVDRIVSEVSAVPGRTSA